MEFWIVGYAHDHGFVTDLLRISGFSGWRLVLYVADQSVYVLTSFIYKVSTQTWRRPEVSRKRARD